MSLRRGPAAALLAALAACGDPDGGDDVVAPPDTELVAPEDSEAPARESDAPPVDSDVVDSEPVDTETPDSPADSDTDVPWPEPPVDWGGTLVEVAGPIWAARPLVVDPGASADRRGPQGTVTYFADVDSDGRSEVVVAQIPTVDAPIWEARVLRFTPAGVVEDEALGAALSVGVDPPFGALDLDGDDWVDLIGGGAHQAVRWGTGRGTFGPWQALGTGPIGPLRGGAVAPLDVDGDGWLDLVFGSWGCVRPGFVAIRTGPRRFDLRDDLLLGATADGFAVLATVLEDGRPLLHVVDNACFVSDPAPHTFRPTGLTSDGYPTFAPYDPAPADAWWKLLPAHAAQPFDAIAPMGSGVEDLDGDGLLDLVVTIGIARQVILRGRGDGTFDDPRGFRTYERGSGPGYPEFPWGVGFPDLDQDGRPEIAWAVGDDAGSFMAEAGHLMKPALSWNAGALRFVDVQDRLGAVLPGSWHAAAVGDPDVDGDADLAFGGDGRASTVYRNDLDVEGRSGVSLRLTGTTSDRTGIGARVEAHVAGLPVRTTVVGGTGSPGGFSDPVVVLGTGAATKVDLLRVHWPSGFVQEVVDLPVGGLYGVEEPPTVEVPDRSAPADGTTTLTVRVTPRTPDGAVDPTRVVTLRVEGAPATLAAPSVRGGVWTARLTAPTRPGSSVVRVSLDGVDLPVAPRVWWSGP